MTPPSIQTLTFSVLLGCGAILLLGAADTPPLGSNREPSVLGLSGAGLYEAYNSAAVGLKHSVVGGNRFVAVVADHGSAKVGEGGVAVGGKRAFAQGADNAVAVVYEGPLFKGDVSGAPEVDTGKFASSLAYSGNGGVSLVKGILGTARAGYDGTAVCQRGGKAVAFDRGIASTGQGDHPGEAVAGAQGIASNRGKGYAVAGAGGVAIAWNGAQAKAGPGGVLIFGYTNAQGAPELQVVKVGEKGTLPNVPYILTPDHSIQRAP